MQLHLAVVHRTGLNKGLADRLVSIGKFRIFTHQGDVDRPLGILHLIDESLQRTQVGFLLRRKVELAEHHLVQMLTVHHQRHFVDRRYVDRLHHRVGIHVAEERHLAPELRRERMLGAQHQNIGLQTVLEQGLDRMLGRLGLQLAGSGQVRNERQMNQRRIAGSKLVTQLTHRFDEGQRLDVAHRTADLGDDYVVLLALRQQLNAALDFVRDMRNDLHGLAQVLALALLVNHALINLTGGHVVGMAGRNRSETLVMAQVEVGFRTVFGHVTLSVLVRIQGSGVDIDIGIQFLNRHRIAACLQQAGDRRRNNAFTERRSHAARHENVLGFAEFHYLFRIILFAPSFIRLRFNP